MTPDERAPEALCTFGIPFPPKTTEHTDAPLIALVQERAALQVHPNAADGDPEANALQDKVTEVQTAIATMPAHSPVGWAQDYARLNREAMMASIFGALNG